MLRAMEEKMTLKKMHLFLAAELLLISLYAVMIPERPVQAAQKKTIFIMGDSKSRYYSDEERPRDGWGQELVYYLKGGKGSTAEFPKEYSGYRGVVRHRLQNLNIENWGQSYASVKTFLDSGRFSGMLQQVNSNDYVIIALGHNDARYEGASLGKYKKNLTHCIKMIQKIGAEVILVTTPPRNFTNAKKIRIYAKDYYFATRKIAKNFGLSCIDLNKECVEYFNFRGKKICNTWYIKYKPGQHAVYPNGIDDSTHFNQKGARILAKIVAVSIQNDSKQKFLSSQFSIHTKKLYKTYSKAKKYKKKNYTKRTWKKFIKERNKAWKVLYSPEAADQQCKRTEKSLKKAMKGLKKHG